MAKPFKCSPLRKGQALIEAISIKETSPLTAGGFGSEVEEGKNSCNDENGIRGWIWTAGHRQQRGTHFRDDNFKPMDWKILVTQSVSVLQILCRREYISTAFVTSSYGLHTHLNSCTR